MTKILQRKFVITSMTAISVLLIIVLGLLNMFNIITVNKQINKNLVMLADNEGNPGNLKNSQNNRPPAQFMEPVNNEHDTFLSSTYFLIRYDTDGNIIFKDLSHISTINETQASDLANQVLNSDKNKGKEGRFYYMVKESRDGGGKIIIFLDRSKDFLSYIRVLFLSIGIGVICWGLMLLFVILLSKKAIKPIAENIEKQKIFVTNAGHEIKTPLAIILANTDAMELYNGENKWSSNIRTQVNRLNGLMKNLLMLARMDEKAIEEEKEMFSISDLLSETVEEFKNTFDLKHISIVSDITDNVTINARKESIKQVFSILLDNAAKYVNKDGKVEVYLERLNKEVCIKINNSADNLSDICIDKLFDRFYRGDKSRTQSLGGYGIGLSVAQSIVESEKGSITAEYQQPDMISFVIKLPLSV